MTEREALVKLGAKDWRSLNKEQIMTFLFETAPDLSNDIRLKIFEVAPEILNTASSIISEYQGTAQKALEGNQQVVYKILDHNHDIARATVTCFHEALETLQGLLVDSKASFEERKYWNEELFKYLREMRAYDKENKEFLNTLDDKNKSWSLGVLKYAGLAALILGGGAIALLTRGKIKLPIKL